MKSLKLKVTNYQASTRPSPKAGEPDTVMVSITASSSDGTILIMNNQPAANCPESTHGAGKEITIQVP